MRTFEQDWKRFSDKIVNYLNSDETYKRDPAGDTSGVNAKSKQ
ncbi:hypothetical protein [Myroides odoratimimus]|nr:hypothetical protein [Myroides odoratimimus]MDX4973686.1 hypothetical protein [Myroides odoratimimus]